MTPERATEIISAAKAHTSIGPWSDNISRVMNASERSDVVDVWRQMPGSTCFVDALQRIANGETDQ